LAPKIFAGGNGGWCIGLTALSPSCANYLEMWELQTAGTLRACPGLYTDLFTFTGSMCHLKIILIKLISWCLLFYHNSNHQLSQQ
jgi:hypothetical protein